jgi:hypothetical protein
LIGSEHVTQSVSIQRARMKTVAAVKDRRRVIV